MEQIWADRIDAIEALWRGASLSMPNLKLFQQESIEPITAFLPILDRIENVVRHQDYPNPLRILSDLPTHIGLAAEGYWEDLLHSDFGDGEESNF